MFLFCYWYSKHHFLRELFFSKTEHSAAHTKGPWNAKIIIITPIANNVKISSQDKHCAILHLNIGQAEVNSGGSLEVYLIYWARHYLVSYDLLE